MPLFPALLQLAVIAVIPGQRNPSALDWDKAEREIRRLPTSAFPGLPTTVRAELIRRECTIPQADGYPEPNNVIKGSFTGKEQLDWAVLCSRGGESIILVFEGDSIEGVSELAKGSDKDYLQTVDEKGKIGYSRMISPVNGGSIVRYQIEFGGPKPPPIDHQGIEDFFVGKASVIHYYHKRRWLRLTGAD